MKKSAVKPGKSETPPDNKKQTFDRQLKLVTGELANLSEHSDDQLVLLRGEKIVWRSGGKKPVAKKSEAKAPAAKSPLKKKGPAGAGRPEKTKLKTSVNELQKMREAKARRAKELLQNKKKPVAEKKVEEAAGKPRSKAFSVSREPPLTKRKKQA